MLNFDGYGGILYFFHAAEHHLTTFKPLCKVCRFSFTFFTAVIPFQIWRDKIENESTSHSVVLNKFACME